MTSAYPDRFFAAPPSPGFTFAAEQKGGMAWAEEILRDPRQFMRTLLGAIGVEEERAKADALVDAIATAGIEHPLGLVAVLLHPDPKQPKWRTGFYLAPPAGEVAELEAALGAPLPQGQRALLARTNGLGGLFWSDTSAPTPDLLRIKGGDGPSGGLMGVRNCLAGTTYLFDDFLPEVLEERGPPSEEEAPLYTRGRVLAFYDPKGGDLCCLTSAVTNRKGEPAILTFSHEVPGFDPDEVAGAPQQPGFGDWVVARLCRTLGIG